MIRVINGVKQLCTLLALYMLSGVFSSLYAAESRSLLLNADQKSIQVAPAIDYVLDAADEFELTDILGMSFTPLEGNNIDFGFTTDKIWLRFSVTNDSNEPLEKVLRTSARFMRPLEIFLLREDSPAERLLFNDETQRFGERPLPELRFLAVHFELQPSETATFYVRFGAGGQATMNLDISSREIALTEQFNASLGITVFAGILITLILVNFFHYLALREPAYLVYVFYESFNVLYISHMEGFTWQYLWPNLPQWNDDATPIIAAGGLIIGNSFAMVFLNSKKYTPFLHKVFLGLVTIAAVILVITLLAGNRIGNQLAAPMLPISLVLCVIAAAIAAKKGHYLARYFMVAWAMFAVTAAIWSGTILGFFDASYNILTVYKITLAAQALILSMGLANQVRRINEQYVSTQGELIESLQGRLEDAKERMKLERENETTMLQLLQKSKQLATTSHDINQPIQSLRLALKALSLKSNEKDSTLQLEKTLDHMESLLGGALDEASLDLKNTGEKSSIQSLVAGNLVSDVVHQFENQARDKNIELKGFDSKAIVVIRELPLKRCLMNLVSNAINNTSRGGVLLGVRRRGNNVLFQVLDTGQGIPESEIDKILEPLNKGIDSSGHGLGLAIIKEICTEYGWTLSIQSRENRGSCFTLTVPIRI